MVPLPDSFSFSSSQLPLVTGGIVQPITSLMKLRYTPDDVPFLFDDPLIAQICDTYAFRRLKGISFLGAIDQHFGHHAHTRYDHSIGVARLAQHYAITLGLEADEQRRVIVAALLHDVGHAPLSHTLEPLFAHRFGLDHHIATAQIIRGEVRTGKALANILRAHKLDHDEILNLISGHDESEMGRIFSSPINADTVEAIWRGLSYFGGNTRFDPLLLVDAFITLSDDGIRSLDEFWFNKDAFYQLMVYSEFGISSDLLARYCVEAAPKDLRPTDFFVREDTFFRKFVQVCTTQPVETEVEVKTRRFTVDTNHKVRSHGQLQGRYNTRRVSKRVSVRPQAWRDAKAKEVQDLSLAFAEMAE